MDTIISVVLSSIIAILITWYFTRKQMKKNEITHFSINSYDIGKGLHDEFPKLQLNYENEVLSEKVLVLKGGFINTGRNDITGLKNNSDVNIILPDDCYMKDIIIRRLSDDVEVNACVDKEKSNVINFSINENFMSGESFEYSAIIEAKSDISHLDRLISFKHRIPNTAKIRNEHLSDLEVYREERHDKLLPFRAEFSIALLCLIFSLVSLFSSLSYLFEQNILCSVVDNNTGSIYSLYVTPSSELYISDSNTFPYFNKKVIKIEEMNKEYKMTCLFNYRWNDSRTRDGLFFALTSVFAFCFSIYFFYVWSKKKRLYNIFEQYEKLLFELNNKN